MATKKVAFKVEVDTSDASKSVDKTKASVKDLGKQTKKTSSDMKKGFKGASDNAKQLGGQMGGATGAAVSFATGIKSMTKAAVAFIATPLGLLLAGIAVTIAAVKAAFTDSEEGQNKYARIMAQIGVVVGNLRDLLADFGEKVIAAFENPQESLRAFGQLVKKNIVNRFEGLVELIPQLGEAVQALFKGDFGQAGKIALDATAKVALGVEDITEKTLAAVEATKEFIKVTQEEVAEGAKVADMRAKADKIERKLLVDRSKAEGKIAELRLKARQEDQFGAEERKAAINEAIVLQDGLLKAETEVLQLRAEAQTLENTFSRSNKENLDKEAKAIAAVNRQTATRLNTQRQFQRELNTINAQLRAEESKLANEKKKEQEDAAKAELALQKDLADAKIELIESEEEREIEKAELDLERRLAKIEGDSEIELELRKALEEVTGVEIQAIKDKYASEESEKKKAADAELLKQDQAVAKARQGVAQSLGSVLGSIASMINQQSKEGVIAAKVLAVAQIAIDTAVAITGAIAQAQSMPYPGNLVAIATGVAAVVAGIASAVTTLNTANVPGPSPPPPTPPPPAPAPTSAGVTTNTTELGNTQQAQLAPIQAFVVETGITGSQQNITQIEGQATFG